MHPCTCRQEMLAALALCLGLAGLGPILVGIGASLSQFRLPSACGSGIFACPDQAALDLSSALGGKPVSTASRPHHSLGVANTY